MPRKHRPLKEASKVIEDVEKTDRERRDPASIPSTHTGRGVTFRRRGRLSDGPVPFYADRDQVPVAELKRRRLCLAQADDLLDGDGVGRREAIRYLGISSATFKRWEREGRITAHGTDQSGKRRYRVRDLETTSPPHRGRPAGGREQVPLVDQEDRCGDLAPIRSERHLDRERRLEESLEWLQQRCEREELQLEEGERWGETSKEPAQYMGWELAAAVGFAGRWAGVAAKVADLHQLRAGPDFTAEEFEKRVNELERLVAEAVVRDEIEKALGEEPHWSSGALYRESREARRRRLLIAEARNIIDTIPIGELAEAIGSGDPGSTDAILDRWIDQFRLRLSAGIGTTAHVSKSQCGCGWRFCMECMAVA